MDAHLPQRTEARRLNRSAARAWLFTAADHWSSREVAAGYVHKHLDQAPWRGAE
jgi:hypothetical protein